MVRADYALFHKPSIPLAVVEAKGNSHATGAGMAQAINYAGLTPSARRGLSLWRIVDGCAPGA